MDQLRIQCTNPDCARWLRVAQAALGHRIRCPACRQELLVPGTLEELHKLQGARYYRIQVTKGPAFVGTEYRLEADRAYTVGRSDECNLQLPGPTVSKRHFSLHWVNNQWVLEDLNTSIGTQVDGLAVTKRALRGGETIEIGGYTLRFVAPGTPLDPAKSAAPMVVHPTNAEPLPVHRDPGEAARDVRQAERALRDARGFTSFTADHLAATAKESSSAFSLSLATRLVVVAALLAVVTVLSIYGKSWLGVGSSKLRSAEAQTLSREAPPDFVAALDAERFDSAAALLDQLQATDPNDPRLAEMNIRFKESANRYRSKLYTEARRALDRDDWGRAADMAQAAQAPVLGPLTGDWKLIADELGQQERLAPARAFLAHTQWPEALAELDKATPANPSGRAKERVATLRRAVLEDMGCGLLVNVEPAGQDVRITVGDTDVPLVGQENWRLPQGAQTLRVAADGFFDHEQRVTFKLGELVHVVVELQRTAPAAAWALLALERAGELPALWIAAKHYGETGALPPALVEAVVARAEGDVVRKLGSAKLRVARATLKSGEELTLRIWSDTSAGISAQVLPQGSARTLLPTDVTRKEDLDPEAAAQAVLGWLRARREAKVSTLDLLEDFARLRLSLAGHDDVAGRVCGEFLTECLNPLQGCCAWCAGAGGGPCPECEGKGTVQRNVTCTFCKGTRRVDCIACNGSGQIECPMCGGTGTVTRKVSEGFINRDVVERCRPCKGTGRVPCRKCNGDRQVNCPKCKTSGEIVDKVPCPVCKKGRVLCPACNGEGTKAGMTPEKRMEAERQAAQRMTAAGG